MLLIDNTAKLNQIMEFKPNTYYKFIALIRAKDYSSEDEQVLKCMEKREILVKDWLIDSQEMLDKTLPDMLTVTEMFKCRLYMCTDRKSIVKTLLQMRKNVDTYLDPFIGNPNAECSVRAIKKISSSASNKDESSDKDGRRWLFDVDTKNPELVNWLSFICADSWLATLQTKSGFHIIAKRDFYADPLLQHAVNEAYKRGLTYHWVNENNTPKFEIKDNAMCLIAMGDNNG